MNTYLCSAVPGLLVYTPHAAKEQLKVIGWLRDDFPDNRLEQGGWLVGRYTRDAFGNVRAEVTEIFTAKTECREPGYIEWSAMEEIRLQRRFFTMQEKLAETDPAGAEELAVIGWWHTHPNNLPVFMSGTDLQTQALKKPLSFAVVLNPHKGVWRAFVGKDAVEVPAIMMLTDTDAPEPNTPPDTETTSQRRADRNNRKQKRHQKRCQSKPSVPKKRK